MVSKEYVEKQLKDLNFNVIGWGRGEVAQLPHIILPDEKIYEVVNGLYEGGFALLLATDVRVVLVDKKPMSFLTVEDLRFDMINEIDYNHRMLGAYITITTGNKVLSFRSYNKDRLRKLIGHVQHSMAETKKKQTTHAEGQNVRLEKINEQLQAYLVAQYKQQQKLQDHLVRVQSGAAVAVPPMPEPIKPSPELADYLYSRGLLEKYHQETGKDLSASVTPAAQAPPVVAQADNQLAEIYADGWQEVFGKPAQPGPPAGDPSLQVVQAVPDQSDGNVLEVNPIRIAYSKLPMALRNRKFGFGGINRPSLRPRPARR